MLVDLYPPGLKSLLTKSEAALPPCSAGLQISIIVLPKFHIVALVLCWAIQGWFIHLKVDRSWTGYTR